MPKATINQTAALLQVHSLSGDDGPTKRQLFYLATLLDDNGRTSPEAKRAAVADAVGEADPGSLVIDRKLAAAAIRELRSRPLLPKKQTPVGEALQLPRLKLHTRASVAEVPPLTMTITPAELASMLRETVRAELAEFFKDGLTPGLVRLPEPPLLAGKRREPRATPAELARREQVVLDALASRRQLALGQVAEELNLSTWNTSAVLRKLIKAGKVAKPRKDRYELAGRAARDYAPVAYAS